MPKASDVRNIERALPKTLGQKELPSNTSGLERDICLEYKAETN